MFRSHDEAPGPVEQAVLAGQHDHRDLLEYFVVLDQRASLVTIEARHHDVDEHDVWLMIGDLGERIEAVDGSEHLTALLGEQCFSGPANGLAVIDHEDFEAREFRLPAGDHALHCVRRCWNLCGFLTYPGRASHGMGSTFRGKPA